MAFQWQKISTSRVECFGQHLSDNYNYRYTSNCNYTSNYNYLVTLRTYDSLTFVCVSSCSRCLIRCRRMTKLGFTIGLISNLRLEDCQKISVMIFLKVNSVLCTFYYMFWQSIQLDPIFLICLLAIGLWVTILNMILT